MRFLGRLRLSRAFGVMNICYPKIRLAWLPDMLGYGVAGSLLAGFFGVLHDQVTYSISHEYFTRLKFAQFQYADFGLSPRIFVAEIGFLATWWVGFFAAWFMARVTVPAFSRTTAVRYTLRGFLIVFGFAFGSSIVGYVLGILHRSDYSAWEDLASALGVLDLPNFVRVVYIHNASYLGGLLGLIAAIIYLRKLRIPNSRFRHQPLRRAVDRFMRLDHHHWKRRPAPAAVPERSRWAG